MDDIGVIIRPGRRSDCKEIRRLIQGVVSGGSDHQPYGPHWIIIILELADFEKMSYGPKIDASVLEHDGFVLQPPLFRTFVAELEGTSTLVGYALYYNKYSTWKGKAMLLEDLYVTADYRKKKIGYALFRSVAKEAYETGCENVDLDVLEWNPARTFYNSLGGVDITEEESWHFYRWTREKLEKLFKPE